MRSVTTLACLWETDFCERAGSSAAGYSPYSKFLNQSAEKCGMLLIPLLIQDTSEYWSEDWRNKMKDACMGNARQAKQIQMNQLHTTTMTQPLM
jgi:hypothetical protein